MGPFCFSAAAAAFLLINTKQNVLCYSSPLFASLSNHLILLRDPYSFKPQALKSKSQNVLMRSQSDPNLSVLTIKKIPRCLDQITLFQPSCSASNAAFGSKSDIKAPNQGLRHVKLTSRNGLLALLTTIVALHLSCSRTRSGKGSTAATTTCFSPTVSTKQAEKLSRLLELQTNRPFSNVKRGSKRRSLHSAPRIFELPYSLPFAPGDVKREQTGTLQSRSFSGSSKPGFGPSASASSSSPSYSSTSIQYIISRIPSLSLASPSKVLHWWNNRILSNQNDEVDGKGKARQVVAKAAPDSTLSSKQSSSSKYTAKLGANRILINESLKITSSQMPYNKAASSSSQADSNSNQSLESSSSNPRSATLDSASSASSTPTSSESSSNSSSTSTPPSSPPPHSAPHKSGRGSGRIHDLMRHPALYSPIRAPRYPIVLCHGLYGFDVRGPFLGLEIHYWAATLDILRKKVGAEVIVRGVPGTGSIQSRAESLHEYLCSAEAGVRGKRLNFAAHSMGGLDVRHLLSHIQPLPSEYIPMSLTTISTPHKGSPFMDWCNANVGVGNDLVEEAIKEEREGRNGAVLGETARKFTEERTRDRAKLIKSNKQNRDCGKGDEIYSGVELVSDVEKGKVEKTVAEEDSIPRPPYTLKTPLFVRPKNGKRANEASQDQKVDTSTFSQDAIDSAKKISEAGHAAMRGTPSDASERPRSEASPDTIDPRGESKSQIKPKDVADETKEKDNKSRPVKTKSKSTSLPFGFSTLAAALSSLTGNFSSYMLSLLDQPAYAMLSTRYMSKVFNPRTPDVPSVKYYSIAARTRKLAIYHPLWLPKLVLDAAAESRSIGGEADGSAEALGSDMQGNDGLVNVQSAKWGEFLGVMEGCDHWDLRGSGGPRWRNEKLDPKTGKIREEHEEKERLKKEKKEKQEKKNEEMLEKEKKKEDSRNSKEAEKGAVKANHSSGGSKNWIDINKLLGSLLSRSSGKDTSLSQDKDKVAIKSAGAIKNSTTSEPSTAESVARNFLENYASLTSSDEGVQDHTRPSSNSASTSSSSSANSVQSSKTSSSSSESANSLVLSSLVPTSLTATPIPDSKIVKEVASWISDRLPERNQERRDLAERRAEIQDRDGYGLRKGGVEGLGWRNGYNNDDSPLTSGSNLSEASKFSLAADVVGEWGGSDVAFISVDQNLTPEQQDEEMKASSQSNLGLTLASMPSLEELNPPPGSISSPDATTLASLSGTASIPTQSDKQEQRLGSHSKTPENNPEKKIGFAPAPEASASSKRAMKLRRDVEWLEALGEGAQARELRRELQWHRAQHVESKSKGIDQHQSELSDQISNPASSRADEALVLDPPDTPVRHPNIRRPNDRDDVYNWDIPNKRRRELLSAMGVRDSPSSTRSNLLTSTQSLASGSSINKKEASHRLGLGVGLDSGWGPNAPSSSNGRDSSYNSRVSQEKGLNGKRRPGESEKQRRERELKEEEVELEKFWLAICRHLWLEGF